MKPYIIRNLNRYSLVYLMFAVLCCGCDSRGTGQPPMLPPVSVSVANPLQRKIVEWNEFTGRIEAVNFVEIRSRVSGYLQSVNFEEGQDVQEGALLFVIDRRPFEAVLEQAKASQKEAEARLEQSKSQLAQANADRETSESQLNFATTDFERLTKIGASVSQTEIDQARNEYLKARANLEASNAGIALASAAIATSAAAIETSKAAVRVAELDLEYTNILAPVAGRISRKYVTEGNLIGGGLEQSTLLTTIVSLNPIYFTFEASEQQVLRFQRLVQEGARRSAREVRYPAYLALADEIDFPHQGYIDFVDNRFDPNTATMTARAVFSNPDGLLTPGMFGRVRIANTMEYEAILLPDAAIGADQAEKFVYVIGDDHQARRQVVETGPIALGLRVIRQGITAEDRVVIAGLQRIRQGVAVEAILEPIVADESDTSVYDSNPVERE